MLRSFFEFLGRHAPVHSGAVFFGVSALVVGYVVYMMVRKQKADPRGGEPEL